MIYHSFATNLHLEETNVYTHCMTGRHTHPLRGETEYAVFM